VKAREARPTFGLQSSATAAARSPVQEAGNHGARRSTSNHARLRVTAPNGGGARRASDLPFALFSKRPQREHLSKRPMMQTPWKFDWRDFFFRLYFNGMKTLAQFATEQGVKVESVIQLLKDAGLPEMMRTSDAPVSHDWEKRLTPHMDRLRRKERPSDDEESPGAVAIQ